MTFNYRKTLNQIEAFSKKAYSSSDEPYKPWPNAGIIPKESRNIIDSFELWLVKHKFSSARMWCKWIATICEESLVE